MLRNNKTNVSKIIIFFLFSFCELNFWVYWYANSTSHIYRCQKLSVLVCEGACGISFIVSFVWLWFLQFVVRKISYFRCWKKRLKIGDLGRLTVIDISVIDIDLGPVDESIVHNKYFLHLYRTRCQLCSPYHFMIFA